MLSESRLVPSGEYVLNRVEEVARDQRFVSAFVFDALPDKVSQVETVLQDLLEIRPRQP